MNPSESVKSKGKVALASLLTKAVLFKDNRLSMSRSFRHFGILVWEELRSLALHVYEYGIAKALIGEGLMKGMEFPLAYMSRHSVLVLHRVSSVIRPFFLACLHEVQLIYSIRNFFNFIQNEALQ